MYEEQITEAIKLLNYAKEFIEMAKLADKEGDFECADTFYDHVLALQEQAAGLMPQDKKEGRIKILCAAVKTAVCRRKFDEAKRVIKKALAEDPAGKTRKDLEEAYCVLQHTAC